MSVPDQPLAPWQKTASILVLVIGMVAAGALLEVLMKSWFGVVGPIAWYRVAQHHHEFIGTDKQHFLISAAGAIGVLLLAVVAVFAILTATDDREQHGSARLATRAEIRKVGMMEPGRHALIIGQYIPQFLYANDKTFVLMIAPSRSGKGIGVVVPNLLNYNDSVATLDIKGEAWELSSGFRQQYGHEVYVWQPYCDATDEVTKELQSKSHRYNPFYYLSGHIATRVGEIREICYALIPDLGGENDFFRGGAREIMLAIALYLAESKRKLTLGEIRRHSHGYGTGYPLQKYLPYLIEQADKNGIALSERCRSLLAKSVNGPEDTIGSYIEELNKGLADWDNAIVVAATDENDFDLRELRRKRMTIYVVVEPNRLAFATRLLNLFFTQLVNLNLKERPEQDATIRHELLLLMDEFSSVGKIAVLEKGIGFIAGYGIRMLTIAQDIAQIEEVYGEKIAATFFSAHGVRVVFPPRSIKDAELLSRTIGTFTTDVVTTSIGQGQKGQKTKNESQAARALFMPQELLAMSMEKPPTELVFTDHTHTIKCERVRYFEDNRLASRVLTPSAVPLLSLDVTFDTPIVKVHTPTEVVTPADVVPDPGEEPTTRSLAEQFDPMAARTMPQQLWAEDDEDYQEYLRNPDAALGEDSRFFAGLVDQMLESGRVRLTTVG